MNRYRVLLGYGAEIDLPGDTPVWLGNPIVRLDSIPEASSFRYFNGLEWIANCTIVEKYKCKYRVEMMVTVYAGMSETDVTMGIAHALTSGVRFDGMAEDISVVRA